MIPLVRSWATLTAVVAAPNPTHTSSTPGHDVVDVPRPGVDRAAEQVHEHQHQHHRQRERRDQRVDVAQRQPQRAADHRQRVAIQTGSWRARRCSVRRACSVAADGLSGMDGLAFGRIRVVALVAFVWCPVRAMKTSSRLAVCSANRAIRLRSRIELVEQRAHLGGRRRRWRRRRSASSARSPRRAARGGRSDNRRRRRRSARRSSRCPGHPLLELVRRCPRRRSAPRSSTAMRSARRSASSRYWVVSSTVTPAAASPVTSSHIACRLRGSRPVVGSSRKITSGLPIRLAARSRRRRMPPE